MFDSPLTPTTCLARASWRMQLSVWCRRHWHVGVESLNYISHNLSDMIV